MEEYLSKLLDSNLSFWASLLMGFLVSLSPCTLAANIAVLSYISKREGKEKKRAIIASMLYVFGKMVAYVLLGFFLSYFAGILKISVIIHHYFGYIIGPIFLIVGVLMLEIIHIHGLASKCNSVIEIYRQKSAYRGSFLLGILLAFAFCPYCGAIYFGGLIPLVISVETKISILLMFAIGSAVPLILFCLLFSYAYNGLKKYYEKVSIYGKLIRIILAILFIITGIMFIFEYYLE